MVWRAKRVAGGASERSELTAGGLAVAAEGSGLRVFDNWRGQNQGEAIDKQWQKNEVIFINWLSYLYYAVGRPNPRFAIME